jgi:hypothetical protein
LIGFDGTRIEECRLGRKIPAVLIVLACTVGKGDG